MTSKTSKNETAVADSMELAIAELATAEAEAKEVNGTASIVRAKKSSAAVHVIVAAVDQKSEEKSLRGSLLSAGVPKGTASKIITVIRAIREFKIADPQYRSGTPSLSGLYALATKGENVEAVETAPGAPTIVEVEKIVIQPQEYATVEDMADDLIKRFILSASDPFTVAGPVMAMITEKISQATAAFAHDED